MKIGHIPHFLTPFLSVHKVAALRNVFPYSLLTEIWINSYSGCQQITRDLMKQALYF